MRRQENKGSAAIAALLALSVLLCLGGGLAGLMKTEADATKNFCEGIAAQGLAEAGVRRALVVLYNNGNPNGLSETVNRDSFAGSYQIVTFVEGTALRVRSSGKVGSARRSASVLVAVALDPTPGDPLAEMTILSWGD